MCPVTNKITKLAAILYVDDCDLLHIDMTTDDSAFVTYEKMQESVLNWGRLLIATGGSYKPPKCFYHLISFKWARDGQWSYDSNHDKLEFEMVVPMPDGKMAKIDHLPVTEAKETLGVWTSPDGSAEGAMIAMRDKAQKWVDKVKEGTLKRSDVWFLMDVQFWPRVGYGLCCNTATHAALERCLSKQYYEILSKGGVIKSAPAVIRQMGKGFYGVGCPHPGIECFIAQISKLLMHYGCPSSNGTKMSISLRQLVIELGMSDQPFQHEFERYKKHVAFCWMVSIWEKCDIYGVKVVFNDSPLKPPRDRDKWIMQEFIRLGYTGVELLRLNRVRRYQQVLFLSDICGASGSGLDERYLKKRPRWENWSKLKFPVEKPTSSDLTLWKLAIRQVVPTAGLAVRLGKFLHDGYKIWEWRHCPEAQHLVHISGGTMDVYVPTSSSQRRWKKALTGCDIEEIGRPCSVRESTGDRVAIVSVASLTEPDSLPETFLDVLREWGNIWMWDSLRLLGEDDWIMESIRDGTCIAVTDGSYIREIFGDMCSCAFVLECTRGRGRILGSFPEQSKRACAYRGELLGLMAIHLVLLAVNKIQPTLRGQVKIYSDCLGALDKITTLPENRIPSGCKHSDILKNIMIHCSGLSFGCEYIHVEAHQDERKSYLQLPRPTQLNCCMDIEAKNVLWNLVGEVLPPQGVFPLENVAVFVGRDKLTSGSEDILRYWCQKKVARETLSHTKVKGIQPDQFDEVEWEAVYQALNEVPRMFQIWACKQVCGVAGTNVMQAKYTPNHCKKCPSCGVVNETCAHVLMCEEAGRVSLLHSSIDMVDKWMTDQGTDPTLRRVLIEYAHGRGGKTMGEIVGRRGGCLRQLARSMDTIGWRRFMEGMISTEVVKMQSETDDAGKCKLTVKGWSAGLVVKLLEVTHGQWLYRNVHVHDIISGEKAMSRKESIRNELEYQMSVGEAGLAEEDQYLLDIDLDDLDHSTGEDQAIWLLALKAARKAQEIRENRANTTAPGGH